MKDRQRDIVQSGVFQVTIYIDTLNNGLITSGFAPLTSVSTAVVPVVTTPPGGPAPLFEKY